MASTEEKIKDIQETVANLQQMMADHVEETPANGKSKAGFDRENITLRAKNAGRNLRSYVNGKRDQLHDAKEKYEGRIKEHPLQSAAIAFASGALIVSLLRRK